MRLPITVITDILSRTVSELSQLIVQILDTAFLKQPFGVLGKTYNVHWKARSGLPISDSLIELFSLVVTVEALRAIIGSKPAISLQRGPVDPKFQVEAVAPTINLFLRKLG